MKTIFSIETRNYFGLKMHCLQRNTFFARRCFEEVGRRGNIFVAHASSGESALFLKSSSVEGKRESLEKNACTAENRRRKCVALHETRGGQTLDPRPSVPSAGAPTSRNIHQFLEHSAPLCRERSSAEESGGRPALTARLTRAGDSSPSTTASSFGKRRETKQPVEL